MKSRWGTRLTIKLARRLAWKLPREVAYWCAIRVMAHATQEQWSEQIVPELRVMDALQRWKVKRY